MWYAVGQKNAASALCFNLRNPLIEVIKDKGHQDNIRCKFNLEQRLSNPIKVGKPLKLFIRLN
jgi:hypothetical protein